MTEENSSLEGDITRSLESRLEDQGINGVKVSASGILGVGKKEGERDITAGDHSEAIKKTKKHKKRTKILGEVLASFVGTKTAGHLKKEKAV